MVDRAELAEFLRTRREALQPEDVGLPRGARRNEVAKLRFVNAFSSLASDARKQRMASGKFPKS